MPLQSPSYTIDSGDAVGVSLSACVAVSALVGVKVGIGVGVCIRVGIGVGVNVGTGVSVDVGINVAVGFGVGRGAGNDTLHPLSSNAITIRRLNRGGKLWLFISFCSCSLFDTITCDLLH
jgi:hypothetical protein